jgi:hypothetical protein
LNRQLATEPVKGQPYWTVAGKLVWFVVCSALFPWIVAMVFVARQFERLNGEQPWGSWWQYLWCLMWLNKGSADA